MPLDTKCQLGLIPPRGQWQPLDTWILLRRWLGKGIAWSSVLRLHTLQKRNHYERTSANHMGVHDKDTWTYEYINRWRQHKRQNLDPLSVAVVSLPHSIRDHFSFWVAKVRLRTTPMRRHSIISHIHHLVPLVSPWCLAFGTGSMTGVRFRPQSSGVTPLRTLFYSCSEDFAPLLFTTACDMQNPHPAYSGTPVL